MPAGTVRSSAHPGVPAPEEGPPPGAPSAPPRGCTRSRPVSTRSPFPQEPDGNQRCLRKLRTSCQGLAGAQREAAPWHLWLRRERSLSTAGSGSAACRALRDAGERPSRCLAGRCQGTRLTQALPCPYLDGSASGQARLLLPDLPAFLILPLVQIQDIAFLHPPLPFLPGRRVKNVTESSPAPTTRSRAKGTLHLGSPHTQAFHPPSSPPAQVQSPHKAPLHSSLFSLDTKCNY